jgi:GNAT superfamily N-acetyltransferase
MSCPTCTTDVPPPTPATGVRISDLTPGDTATVRTVFEGLSGRSRYLRFHAGRSTLPIRMQRGLADTVPGHHVAHVALLGDRPIGLIRWIRFTDNRQHAELAVEVVDAFQRLGVGRALLARAARSALASGLQGFLAYFSVGNSELRTRTLGFGATVDPHDPSLLLLPVAALLASIDRPAPRIPLQRRP